MWVAGHWFRGIMVVGVFVSIGWPDQEKLTCARNALVLQLHVMHSVGGMWRISSTVP